MKKLLITTLFLLYIMHPQKAFAIEEPVAGIVVPLQAFHERIDGMEPVDRHIEFYSALYGVDGDLVRAVINGESSWDPKAYNRNRNGSHDSGLMQINSCNHEWLEGELGITDFYEPEQNIRAGTFILADIMKNHTDIHEILMCYNAGWKRTRELHKQGIYSSRYSRTVVMKFNHIKGGYEE